MVVGKFAGETALAAVGSTGPAINVMINLFFGIDTAVNIYIAQKFGANDEEGLFKAVHTTAALSLILGITLGVFSIAFAKKLLTLMGSPEDVIELSALYMRIYFIGIPANMVFSCGSAVLRATGDSKHPTFYSVLSGIINVILNLVLVIVFKLGVAGVGIATVVAQLVSAFLVVTHLLKNRGCVALDLKKIKIYSEDAKKLLLLGIPVGLQNVCISLSNVVVQTTINGCGSEVMAASSAAYSLEGIVYITLYAFFQAAITFTGQNYGCGNLKRIRKGHLITVLVSLCFTFVFSQYMLKISPWTLRLYSDSKEVVSLAQERMNIVCAAYFLGAVAEVTNGTLRGLCVVNKAVFVTIICDLGVRVAMAVIGAPFETAEDLKFMFLSFPVSWILTGICLAILYLHSLNKIEKSRKKGELL